MEKELNDALVEINKMLTSAIEKGFLKDERPLKHFFNDTGHVIKRISYDPDGNIIEQVISPFGYLDASSKTNESSEK